MAGKISILKNLKKVYQREIVRKIELKQNELYKKERKLSKKLNEEITKLIEDKKYNEINIHDIWINGKYVCLEVSSPDIDEIRKKYEKKIKEIRKRIYELDDKELELLDKLNEWEVKQMLKIAKGEDFDEFKIDI